MRREKRRAKVLNMVLCMLLAEHLLSSCGAKDPTVPSTSSALPPPVDTSDLAALRADIVAALPSHLRGGYVVTVSEGGDRDQGDSLGFSYVSLASQTCDEGDAQLQDLAASVHAHHGAFLRFDPLPTEYTGNEISRDHVVMAMYGLVSRWRRCPEERPLITALWAEHVAFVDTAGDTTLFPGSSRGNIGGVENAGFRWLWERVSRTFGARTGGLNGKRDFVLDGHAVWDYVGTTLDKCYLGHLDTLMLITAAWVGDPVSSQDMASTCAKSAPTGLVLQDWLCGRGDAHATLAGWLPPRFVYRPQRCGNDPGDLPAGASSPLVDWLNLEALVSGKA